MCEKTQAELLKEELFYSAQHASYTCDDDEIAVADDFCEGYKDFLNNCKTEREAVVFVKELAEKTATSPLTPRLFTMQATKFIPTSVQRHLSFAHSVKRVSKTVQKLLLPTSIHPALTSNPIPFTRTLSLLFSKHTITAVSRNISGPQHLLLSMVSFIDATVQA